MNYQYQVAVAVPACCRRQRRLAAANGAAPVRQPSGAVDAIKWGFVALSQTLLQFARVRFVEI